MIGDGVLLIILPQNIHGRKNYFFYPLNRDCLGPLFPLTLLMLLVELMEPNSSWFDPLRFKISSYKEFFSAFRRGYFETSLVVFVFSAHLKSLPTPSFALSVLGMNNSLDVLSWGMSHMGLKSEKRKNPQQEQLSLHSSHSRHWGSLPCYFGSVSLRWSQKYLLL